MKDNCEKCGWPMTITAGGDEMHCGRKYYQNDYAFCLEKQCEKLHRELNEANMNLKQAYAEMRKQRPVIKAVFDRSIWIKAEEDKL